MPSTACWSSDARSPSASPEAGRGWGNCAHTSDPCNTLARGRFFSAADIGGSGFSEAGPRIAISSAVLQNTLEQALFAVVTHLVLASLLRGREMIVVPLLVGLFCAGRLAFWLGYKHGAGGRAFGFGLTFYPSVLALGLAFVMLALRG